jgi:two-component system response regulator FixJ
MTKRFSSSESSSGDPCQPTVFVVDDDVSFLRSVSRLLRLSGFQVSAFDSAAELLADLRPDTSGCVITDLMMPGMDGLALQNAMKSAGCALPVVFLTGKGDIPTTVQAMRRGAEDFLTKNAPKEELIAAVQRSLAHDEADRAKRSKLMALRQKFALLTAREREVLQHVVQGKLNKQIAADLGIHERTVKLHRTNLTGKLNVYSVAELTSMAHEAEIFHPAKG